MGEFLSAFVYHYGWLWWLIGLFGFIVIVITND